MQIILRSKNLEVSQEMRDYADQKFGKLDRYLDNIIEATVELSAEHTRSNQAHFVAQVTMLANGAILRGEERAGDLNTAIDAVADLMQRQMLRYKEKVTGRGRATAANRSGAKISAATVNRLTAGEKGISKHLNEVVRTKRFTINTLSIDEAIEQMELLGHDFFVYRRPNTDNVNIVYKRRDGTYGLLEPELE